MTSLETKLNAILNDKLTNLKPENLKKGVTCLGVTGTLEASTSSGGIKQFSTVEEMNSSTGNTEGDLAVVYNSVLRNIQNGDVITTIIFPETVTFDTAITSHHMDRIESGDYVLSLMLSDTEAYIEYMSNDGSLSYYANYSSEDGLTYTNMAGEEVYTIPAMTISNANEYTCKFVKSNILSFGGLYKYSGTAWELAPTDLTTVADDVYKSIFYGKNGVETGTLTENISDSFADINAEIYDKIQKAYATMEPKILTDTDKTIDKNIYFIPVNAQGEPLLNTNSVTDMDRMFQSCKNLTTTPQLDTSNVTNMNRMFSGCSNLTTIPLLDTSNVTNMYGMFDSCKNLTTIPLLDTSSVTKMAHTFQSCTNLTAIPELNTSQVTRMDNMFDNCTNLATIPSLNTSSVTLMNYMFRSCTNLTTIPQLDTNSVTDMSYMFQNCTNLMTVPSLNTSSVTKMDSMFNNCTNLTTIPELNTSNVTSMNHMFDSCANLTTMLLLNTSSVTSMGYMFYGCKNLTNIPELNTSSVTTMTYMFKDCTSLSDESLNNILAMCANANSYTGTKTLNYIGLTSEQATKCTTLSNYSAFTAAGWTTGY